MLEFLLLISCRLITLGSISFKTCNDVYKRDLVRLDMFFKKAHTKCL